MTPRPTSGSSTPSRRNGDATDAHPLIVYFDGSCPLCSAEIGHYARLRGSERLCFVDVSVPGAQTGADLLHTDAMRRFHVRQANGQLLSGARAFVAIWETLPAWRPAARLARLPGVTALLDIAYRLFLSLRPLLSRLAAALDAQPRRYRVR